MILTIRTDKPEAEIGLYLKDRQVAYKSWTAHRELSTTIHVVIDELLRSCQVTTQDIMGIVYYKGPGSFTGLRIGAAVANALSAAECIPLVQSNEEHWIDSGMKMLKEGKSQTAQPYYDSEPHITKPKK